MNKKLSPEDLEFFSILQGVINPTRGSFLTQEEVKKIKYTSLSFEFSELVQLGAIGRYHHPLLSEQDKLEQLQLKIQDFKLQDQII